MVYIYMYSYSYVACSSYVSIVYSLAISLSWLEVDFVGIVLQF